MMKKTISIGLILLLLPIVIADIEEPKSEENIQVSPNGIVYFIKTTLPEFFISIPHFFDRDNRVNWKLQQLERRKAEYEYLLTKLNQTTSEQWKQRYLGMIKIISKRLEQTQKKLEKYASLLRVEKQERIKQILGQRDQKLNEIRNKFINSGNNEALQGITIAIEQSQKIRDKLSSKLATISVTSDNSDAILQHGVGDE